MTKDEKDEWLKKALEPFRGANLTKEQAEDVADVIIPILLDAGVWPLE